MLTIDTLRVRLARHILDGMSLDRALGEVITHAYERGLDEGRRGSGLVGLAKDLLDPEIFGHAVTAEVRRAAKKALNVPDR